MTRPIVGTMVLCALVACGGGGGSDAPGTPNPATPPPPQPANTGSVIVTVVDVFGQPVEGATANVNDGTNNFSLVTDANGRAQFDRIPSGEVFAYAGGEDDVRGGYFGNGPTATLDRQIELQVTVLPAANPVVGSTRVTVDPADISADRKTLTFSLTLRQLHDEYDWPGIGLSLAPCAPDPSNDGADCVGDANGFDASYEVLDPPPSTWVEFEATGTPQPYIAALLLDQSRRIVANDPWDLRLFGVKYLILNLAQDSLQLAAFAADDLSHGELAMIDDRPVTLIDADADVSSYDAIDELAASEGGASPLYAALAETIDHVAAIAPTTGQRRAVVVLTDGHDDTCGSIEACAEARQLVVDKSIASQVEIVMLVLPGGSDGDRRVIAELVAASNARAFWPDDPAQLAVLLGMLPEILSGRGDTAEVTFRIEADAADVFASGRTVYGTMKPEICPWDCYVISFPIAIHIP